MCISDKGIPQCADQSNELFFGRGLESNLYRETLLLFFSYQPLKLHNCQQNSKLTVGKIKTMRLGTNSLAFGDFIRIIE